MNGFDRQTLEFYDASADVYVDQYARDVTSYIPSFLDLLPARGAILELGCGGGVDAAYMEQRGFAVDATDGVPAMAAKAQRNLTTPVRVMRFDELDEHERYDAVIASASLLHVPKDDLPDILAKIWRALKPGGRHVATYKTGCAAARDDHARYYNRPTASELEDFYRQAGPWTSLEIKTYMGSGYFGDASAWLEIMVQK